MQKLERRVEALEHAGGGSKARVATVVEFVRPGHLDAPIQELRTLDGRCWKARPGESKKALIRRAAAETKGQGLLLAVS